MTDYIWSGDGVDAPGTNFLSLEYALENGGMSEGDRLLADHVNGVPTGDYWKAGTNNQINATLASGTGEFRLESIDNDVFDLALPADMAAQFIVLAGAFTIGETVKITNPNGNTGHIFRFSGACDFVLDGGEIDGNGAAINAFGAYSNTNAKSLTLQNGAKIHDLAVMLNSSDTASTISVNFDDVSIYDLTSYIISAPAGMNFTFNGMRAWGIPSNMFYLRNGGYTYDIQESLFVKTVGDTSQRVFGWDDTTCAAIKAGTEPLDGIQNNIFWVDGTITHEEIDNLVQGVSGNYSYLSIPSSNRFIRPDGDSADGWSWPTDEKTNPSLVEKSAFFGDSIAAGSQNSSGEKVFEQFNTIMVQPVVDDTYGTNYTKAALGGLGIPGARFWIDFLMTEVSPAPKYVFIIVGINSVGKTNVANADIAEAIGQIIDKIEAYGATPIWLGIPSNLNGVTTDTDAINALVEAAESCKTVSISDQMKVDEPADWETTFYDDLTTNLHPNGAGTALIAKLARGQMENLLEINDGKYPDSTTTFNAIGDYVTAGMTLKFTGACGDIDLSALAESETASINVDLDGYITSFAGKDGVTAYKWEKGGGQVMLSYRTL